MTLIQTYPLSDVKMIWTVSAWNRAEGIEWFGNVKPLSLSHTHTSFSISLNLTPCKPSNPHVGMCWYWVTWSIIIFTIKASFYLHSLSWHRQLQNPQNFILYGSHDSQVNRFVFIASHTDCSIQHEPILWLEQIIKLKSQSKYSQGYRSIKGQCCSSTLCEVNSMVALTTYEALRSVEERPWETPVLLFAFIL